MIAKQYTHLKIRECWYNLGTEKINIMCGQMAAFPFKENRELAAKDWPFGNLIILFQDDMDIIILFSLQFT